MQTCMRFCKYNLAYQTLWNRVLRSFLIKSMQRLCKYKCKNNLYFKYWNILKYIFIINWMCLFYPRDKSFWPLLLPGISMSNYLCPFFNHYLSNKYIFHCAAFFYISDNQLVAWGQNMARQTVQSIHKFQTTRALLVCNLIERVSNVQSIGNINNTCLQLVR